MGKILEAFLTEQLHLNDIMATRTSKHQEIYEKSNILLEKLAERLNDEEKKLLDSLVETLFDEGSCYAQSKFMRGYQLGVLMTMEVFDGQDTFL